MAKTNGAKPDASDDGFNIDLNGIKAKERKQFVADTQQAISDNDDDLVVKWMARVVKEWPYDDIGKPGDEASYGELGLVQMVEVSKRFFAAFQRLAESASPTPDSGKTDGEGRPAGTTEGVQGG